MGAGGLTIASVAPGTHEIAVTKRGYLPAKETVTLSSGDTREVAIEMAAEAPAPAPTSAETPTAETPAVEPTATVATESTETVTREAGGSGSREGRTGAKVAAWASLAAGLTGIGIGIYYSYLVNHANGQLDPWRRFTCPVSVSPSGLCDQSGKKADPDPDYIVAWMTQTKTLADRYQNYQWIGYGVGAAMLATSAGFFYYGYLSRSSGATADARGSSFQLAPVLSREGMGAMAFTTF
jgi:hypothetical protein